ncbi:MAG: acyl-CoA dehydrogenase family protein [Chloroflexota bacterium]
MDLRFSPEEERFRQEVREFLARELPPDWVGFRGLEERGESAEEWAFFKQMAKKLGQKGWLSLSWPREFGGGGVSPMMEMVFEEEMYYHRAPGRDIFGTGMLAPTLIHYGTREQQARHLAGVARGGVFWCQGFSEPGAGSDLASLQTRAVDKGDHFVVNGQKVWSSGAHKADWCFFLARTDPEAPKHRGISMFLVDMKSRGVTVRPLMNMVSMHSFNELFFDEVKVPRENLVGEKNGGWYAAMTTLNFERSGIIWFAGGRRTLEDLVRLANERGGLSPEMRLKLADLAVGLQVGRNLSYLVVWKQSRGFVPDYEAAMAKVYGSELNQRLAQTAMELLGFYGLLVRDSKYAPLQGWLDHLYLRSVGNTIEMGTSEVQRNIIALRGLGLPR